MDPIGWAIANLHQLLGHDKAAAVLGVPPWPGPDCLLCVYEAEPTAANRQAVLIALYPRIQCPVPAVPRMTEAPPGA